MRLPSATFRATALSFATALFLTNRSHRRRGPRHDLGRIDRGL